MAWDKEEFAAVFRNLYPNLCRFLECMTGRRGIAQEIAQESFLRLYRKGPESLPEPEVRFWIYRVARNLALNELNRSETRSKLFERAASLFRPHAPGPEEQFEHAERKEILFRLMESLSADQRAAFLLREQEEMSYREIARVLNVSESKVKVDIHRARALLRARWNEIQDCPAKAAN
jgi:RNA polymerase sigma-70 factor (ECF subfamily)